jgi:hypothetical protein
MPPKRLPIRNVVMDRPTRPTADSSDPAISLNVRAMDCPILEPILWAVVGGVKAPPLKADGKVIDMDKAIDGRWVKDSHRSSTGGPEVMPCPGAWTGALTLLDQLTPNYPPVAQEYVLLFLAPP